MKQKDFVVSEVERVLGTRFEKFKTNAILVLSKDELELIKETTLRGILNGQVDYAKVGEPVAETRTYARSLVMNHLKKSRELNGNVVYSSSGGTTRATKADPAAPKGIVSNLLPQELQDYVRNLV